MLKRADAEQSGRRSVPQRIADAIDYDIAAQGYGIGERLIETQLAEQYGASRSSVREALRILAARGSYATLPARKEGIIPGMANLRLPRFVGDRIARQAVQYERRIDFDTPEGLLLADEVVAPGDMDSAIERVANGLISSGAVSASGNRRAFRIAQEPLTLFCRYLSVYAREQAYCLSSPALISNLERFWNAASRRLKP